MANDREELQRLRELDRLAELEAKAGGAPVQQAQPAPAAPAFQDTPEGRVQELLANKDPFQLPNGMQVPMPIPVPATAGGGLIRKAAEGSIKDAIRAGAQEGALQGAGSSMNEEDLFSRIGHTALGTGLGAGAGGIAGIIGKGAQVAKDTKLLSKPAEAARWVQGQFGSAKDKLETFLKGQTDIIEQGVKGKPISMDLQEIRRLKEIRPELGPMVDEAMASAQPVEASFRSSLGPSVKRVGDVLPGEVALPIKRAVGKAANFQTKGVSDPIHIARSEEAAPVYRKLADQFNNISPEVASANKMVSDESIPLIDLLENKGVSEDVVGKLLTPSARPTLARVDELVDTDLQNIADRTALAKWLQPNSLRLNTVTGALSETGKMGVRAANSVMGGVSKVVPEGSKDAILAAALAAAAPKQKGKK